MDRLTAQQKADVATLQSVTGCSQSRSLELLQSSGFSVDEAVANFFAIQGAGEHGGSSAAAADPYGSGAYGGMSASPVVPNSAMLPTPSPPPPSSAQTDSSSASSFMSRPAPASATATSAAAASPARPSPPPVGSPGDSGKKAAGGGLLGSVFGALGRAVFGGPAAAAASASSSASGSSSSASSSSSAARTPQQQFLHSFGEKYGPFVPNFVSGSYTDAVKEAKAQNRMLFLYLHCPTHDDTETFVRGTLCTESVCNFLRENFVSWAGSIKSADAYRLAQTLSVASFPYVAALSPQGGSGSSSVAVVFRHTGPLSAEDLMSQLLLRMETHESIMGSMAAQRSSQTAVHQESRSIREQQDLEYQESLLMDQSKKEQEAREAAELEDILRRSREAEAAAEAQRVREAEEAEAARLAAEAERAQLAAALPAEPAAGEDGVVTVSLRLPTGAKVARRFRDSQPLRHVRTWVQSLEEMASTGSKFRLLSNFPRKVHEEQEQALADLKLGRQILFVVEAIDDEEE